MARGFYFQLSCLLLASATVTVQHSVETTRSSPQPTELNSSLAELNKCSSGNALGTVVAHLAAELHSTKSQLRAELQTTQAELQSTKTKLQTTQAELLAIRNLKTNQGSTFVRWGRNSCPANTSLVYSGFAGGKFYSHPGSGSNRLCLTPSPQFDSTPVPVSYATLYGAEYDYIPGHHDQDVPCSVCRAAQSTTIMVAGTLTCPRGWTSQYTGHLAAERDHPHHTASEYVCLDRNPQHGHGGGHRDSNGLLFNLVITVCGALPCPPYSDRKVVTCAVCSK